MLPLLSFNLTMEYTISLFFFTLVSRYSCYQSPTSRLQATTLCESQIKIRRDLEGMMSLDLNTENNYGNGLNCMLSMITLRNEGRCYIRVCNNY